jgi:hypothetical protein
MANSNSLFAVQLLDARDASHCEFSIAAANRSVLLIQVGELDSVLFASVVPIQDNDCRILAVRHEIVSASLSKLPMTS